MGYVKELTVTGDNDAELFPEEYYRYYMYCDRCGSFKIAPWMASENQGELRKKNERTLTFLTISLVSLVLSIAFAIFLHAFIFFTTATFVLDTDSLIWIMVSLVSYFIFNSSGNRLESKLEQLGVCCEVCKKQYRNGSSFFTNHESNPKNYTMKDVPLPRNTVYWVRG